MKKYSGPLCSVAINNIRPVIVGSFGPPTLACIRNWGRDGGEVGMVCVRSENEAFPQSKKHLIKAKPPGKKNATNSRFKQTIPSMTTGYNGSAFNHGFVRYSAVHFYRISTMDEAVEAGATFGKTV